MSTYTNNFSTWKKEFLAAYNHIPISKLGIGLDTTNEKTKEYFTEPEITARFEFLTKFDTQMINIWRMPLPSFWWHHIESFKKQN